MTWLLIITLLNGSTQVYGVYSSEAQCQIEVQKEPDWNLSCKQVEAFPEG